VFVQAVVRFANVATRSIKLFFLDYQGYCLLLPNDAKELAEKLSRMTNNNFPSANLCCTRGNIVDIT